VKQALDAEFQAESLQSLPSEFYSSIAHYTRTLKRSMGSGNSDVANRLINTQLQLIGSMVSELFSLRADKASRQRTLAKLLPEERHVLAGRRKFDRESGSLVDAVSSGHPSYLEHARRVETSSNTTVRFVRKVG